MIDFINTLILTLDISREEAELLAELIYTGEEEQWTEEYEQF